MSPGCMGVTCTLKARRYVALQKAHLEVFQRVFGFQADHTNLSYANVLKKTKRESIKTTIRKRRLFFAGAMVRQRKGRLPNRMMLAQIVGGRNPGPGEPPNDSLRTLRDDVIVFIFKKARRKIHHGNFGVGTVLLVHAANKTGKW